MCPLHLYRSMQVQIKCTIHEMEKMILFFIFGVFKCHFQQYFSYIVATSFSVGGSRSTGKLYHLWLRVECTLFCNLQCWARTQAVLVIGLYELLDPMT